MNRLLLSMVVLIITTAVVRAEGESDSVVTTGDSALVSGTAVPQQTASGRIDSNDCLAARDVEEELNMLKGEMKKLKERLTELNNSVEPVFELKKGHFTASSSSGFSNSSYSFINDFGVRFKGRPYKSGKQGFQHMMLVRLYYLNFEAIVGTLCYRYGASFGKVSVYNGIEGGVLYQLFNTKLVPIPVVMFNQGFEYFATKKECVFIEIGVGNVLHRDESLPYNNPIFHIGLRSYF